MTPIKQYEENYTINSNGIITNIKTKKNLKISPNTQTTYLQVDLWKNNKGSRFYLHRLLGEHFIPNPENKSEINHIDGNKQNNHLSNLEWVTSSENSFHAVKTGLRTYTNRLTKQEFIDLLYDVINGESYQSLSQRVPYKVPFISVKLRRIAIEHCLVHKLDSSLKKQRLARALNNLKKINK